jgi:hypothetical protein
MLNADKGAELKHSGRDAEKFYRDVKLTGVDVRGGLEARAYAKLAISQTPGPLTSVEVVLLPQY